MYALLDTLVGKHATEAYETAIKIMRGEITQKVREPGPGEDAVSYALVPTVAPKIRERLDAAIWLAEQRNGKAKASIDLDVDTEVRHVTFDPSKLSDEELKVAEEIARKSAESVIESTTH